MSSSSSGPMSSAGLVRYFDADSSTTTFQPHTVIAVGVLLGVGLLIARLAIQTGV